MKNVAGINIDQASYSVDKQKAERLLRLSKDPKATRTPEEEQEIMKSAEQFEAMLIKSMLDSMRKNIQSSDLFGDPNSASKSIYQSMLDNEYAGMMAKNQQLGLAEVIMEQFGLEPEEIKPVPASYETLLGVSLEKSRGFVESKFINPLRGRISSPFGMRSDPINGELRMHHGVDIAVPIGKRVHSAAEGEVVFAGEQRGYGKVVIVRHEDGYETVYGHLDKIDVDEGDMVRKGQTVARSGNTGRSTGPHLHFEIRIDGKSVNPGAFVDLD